MKVPLKWLHEYVDPDVSVEDFSHRLTMAGLEVEKIEHVGADWDHVFVGIVRDVTPHPDADRLVLADVDALEHRLTVVTGAPNIAAGQHVALALAGAQLIDGYSDSGKRKKLKPTKMRGILSEGMVCSEKELGLSDEHEGILVLDEDAPVGTPISDYLGDTVVEFEITPNLVHDFSIFGIARETAAVFDTRLNMPERYSSDPGLPQRDDSLVTIESDDLCARYMGVVFEGIRVEKSPQWLARKLQLAGVRPINNIVDITNYTMLEFGQPLHAFDYDTLSGQRIVVRRAKASERMETLDHEKRELDESMPVIADADNPVGIAGVMGGVDTEVQDSTTRILLEAANFDMKSVRQTARTLRLRTEASSRFERGLDPELVEQAISAATSLILDVCTGSAAVRYDDVYPDPVEPSELEMPFSRIEQVLGIEYPVDQVSDVLERLDFNPEIQGPPGDRKITVSVPTYRHDVSIPDDIVEEVARIIGYDSLPSTLPSGQAVPVQRDEMFLLQRRLRGLLTGSGLSEMISYVTISGDMLNTIRQPGQGPFGLLPGVSTDSVLRLRNPMQETRPVLRPSVIPSMLETLSANLKHSSNVQLFEFSHVFLPDPDSDLPSELDVLGIVMAGNREPFSRYASDGDVDFFDLKGITEVILARSGVQNVTYENYAHPSLHPGRNAIAISGDSSVGVVGELHPAIASQFGIDAARVCVAEFDLEAVLAVRFTEQPSVHSPKFLPVQQDFAVVVDESTSSSDVAGVLWESAHPLVSSVDLFDVYSGESIDEGYKSLAYRVTFTAPDRNLTDDDLVKTRKRIEKALRKHVGGTLRA